MSELPTGFRVVADPSLKRYLDGRLLIGGAPVRVMRLTDTGRAHVERLLAGDPVDDQNAQLAGHLVDAGLGHPRPPEAPRELSVEVAIPVRDRPLLLDRCLRALGRSLPVTVVDDGSADPEATAEICRAHDARLLRIAAPGRGPAAARNLAIQAASSDLIVFIDSDVVPPAGWLESLTLHFTDPDIGAVAPRVRPLQQPGDSLLERYASARSPLDMGQSEGQVTLLGRVAYVPTAALVVRHAALRESKFDERLLCGEDVDLVWRLQDAGWRIRYDPRVTVLHDEPASWRAYLGRRHRYGRSVGPLAKRHPRRVVHVVVAPLPTAALGLALLRQPRAAALLALAHGLRIGHQARPLNVPPAQIAVWTAQSVTGNAVGVGTAATQLAGPLVAAGLLYPRTRIATAALLVTAPVIDYVRSRPRMNPAAWVAARVADEAVYGAGVLAACARERTVAPLRPRLAHRSSSPASSSIWSRFTSERGFRIRPSRPAGFRRPAARCRVRR